MRSIVPLFAALALSACATLPAAAPIRGDGLARLNQATRVGALVVTPRAVVEDSRCPINARCIWAGRAIVRTEVVGAGWRETLNLTLGERVSAHGTALSLTSLEPGKMAGAEPQPLDYTMGFEGGL
ncbi:MAG: hypothetical protein LH466_03375 [Sphingomonas bacterium]|nr:hypothetical protein [Sphingomonas bacterium]